MKEKIESGFFMVVTVERL